MKKVKDSKQAMVRIGYDGRVHKYYYGPKARERFDNELYMLQYLEKKECLFVPRVLEFDHESLYIVTTNCGAIVNKMNKEKMKGIFAELETYGVRHGDAFMRNVTYSSVLGRFCLIDFEFATIIETGEGLKVEDVKLPGRDHTNWGRD